MCVSEDQVGEKVGRTFQANKLPGQGFKERR